jgi:hypothetical protein
VIAEAQARVIAAIESIDDDTTADLAAAFATLTGMWKPSLVVATRRCRRARPERPVVQRGDHDRRRTDRDDDQVLDPLAVTGLLADAAVSTVEPSLLGRRIASLPWDKVSISPGGAAPSGDVTACGRGSDRVGMGS